MAKPSDKDRHKLIKQEEVLDSVMRKPSKLRRFLYILAWIAIVPILLGLPAAMATGAALAKVATWVTENAVQSMELFYAELSIFLATITIAVILFLIKWLLKTRKHLFPRVGAGVLGVYIWIGILLSGSLMTLITFEPDVIKPELTRDAHLMSVLHTVGGKDSLMKDVSIKYVKSYKDKDYQGMYTPVLNNEGNFAYATITVKKGISKSDERTTVAHEYLHHIWQAQLDTQTLHDLTSQLMTMYGNDDWMKGRTDIYSDTNMLEPTELFSFYCTEVNDRYLTKYVLKQCNKYIDRSTLSFMRR